jgi:cytochrome c
MSGNLEFNKIAGAVLGTALVVMGLNELGNTVFHVERPEEGKKGFLIEVAEAESKGGEAAAEPGEAKSIGVLLASADVAKGANGAKACGACHDFTKGGPNKVGPNLWDIVERPRGGHEGYKYSEPMASKKDPWTYESLSAYLADPKGYIPGNKMAFGGIKNDAKRADLIAYLASLSDAPKPFPAP